MTDFTWEVRCIVTDEVKDSGSETTLALAKTASAAALVTEKTAAGGTYELNSTVFDSDDVVAYETESVRREHI